MVNNLDGKLENSKIPAVVASDVNDDEVEIDLREILQALKRKILLILMVALIGGCGAGAYTQFMMTPIYSSTSSMLVLSKETTLTSLADLQLGASLTSDYTVLITSTPVLEQVIENLKLDMTAEDLRKTISINNPTDTRILEITVNNADSALACAAIVVVLTIMDDTIKTEEDIEKYLGISVLAKVPDRKDFVNVKSKKNKKKSHR